MTSQLSWNWFLCPDIGTGKIIKPTFRTSKND